MRQIPSLRSEIFQSSVITDPFRPAEVTTTTTMTMKCKRKRTIIIPKNYISLAEAIEDKKKNIEIAKLTGTYKKGKRFLSACQTDSLTNL